MAIWADSSGEVVVGVELPPPPELNAVDAARQFVDLNPQDPQAHYNLAMALADDGQDVAAMGEYQQALDLAGDHYDFYMNVGRDLSGRGLWPQAAMAYLRLAQLHPAPLPPEMGNALHESLYEAAASPDFLNIISLDELTAYDNTLGGVMRARYDLFNERTGSSPGAHWCDPGAQLRKPGCAPGPGRDFYPYGCHRPGPGSLGWLAA